MTTVKEVVDKSGIVDFKGHYYEENPGKFEALAYATWLGNVLIIYEAPTQIIGAMITQNILNGNIGVINYDYAHVFEIINKGQNFTDKKITDKYYEVYEKFNKRNPFAGTVTITRKWKSGYTTSTYYQFYRMRKSMYKIIRKYDKSTKGSRIDYKTFVRDYKDEEKSQYAEYETTITNDIKTEDIVSHCEQHIMVDAL
jgi:hypothetical protein